MPANIAPLVLSEAIPRECASSYGIGTCGLVLHSASYALCWDPLLPDVELLSLLLWTCRLTRSYSSDLSIDVAPVMLAGAIDAGSCFLGLPWLNTVHTGFIRLT